MRATVFGGSGRTGRLVVEKALERGFEVIAVSRAPRYLGETLPDVSAAGPGRLHVLRGDVLDLSSVESAIEGSECVLSTIAPPLHRHVIRPTTVYSVGIANVIRAMRTFGVRRLITVSSAGVRNGDPSHPPFYRYVLKPLLFDRALYEDMRVMEGMVESSDLDWTIVRAAGLTDHPPSGRYRVGAGQLPDGGSRISRADLADFLLQQLEERTHERKRPTLAL